MKSRYLRDGSVQASTGECADLETLILRGLVQKNEFVTPYVPSKETPDGKIAAIREVISEHIEKAARGAGLFGFDSIITAVSYADDMADTVNQPMGAALVIFRRDCWSIGREFLSGWQSGGAEPTLEEVIANLPEFVEPVNG